MSDNDWKNYRLEQQARREKRLPKRTDEIMALKGEGFDVKEMTPYQFRINGRLDLYPIHNRWHDIKTNTRGGHRNLAGFAREWRKQ